jgi:hypothetical protein
MDNSLEIIVKESGLQPSKAQYILEKFQDHFKMAAEWEKKARAIVVTSVDQKAEMKMAREGRLFLKERRVQIERARKEMKEESLREGKAIDGISNVLKALIQPIETYLENQEKFEENQQKAMLEALRLEEEKKAEADRIRAEEAEREARAKMEAENKRLREEAEAREKELLAQTRKAEEARRAQAAAELEKQRVIDEQKAKEAAEEQAKKDEAKEARRVQRLKKYKEFLESHWYTKETASMFHVEQNGSQVRLFKLIGEIDLDTH